MRLASKQRNYFHLETIKSKIVATEFLVTSMTQRSFPLPTVNNETKEGCYAVLLTRSISCLVCTLLYIETGKVMCGGDSSVARDSDALGTDRPNIFKSRKNFKSKQNNTSSNIFNSNCILGFV
jgi:hypothetical protein